MPASSNGSGGSSVGIHEMTTGWSKSGSEAYEEQIRIDLIEAAKTRLDTTKDVIDKNLVTFWAEGTARTNFQNSFDSSVDNAKTSLDNIKTKIDNEIDKINQDAQNVDENLPISYEDYAVNSKE